MVTGKRRIGGTASKTRAALLDAATDLIANEGVFSLTAGRLGESIGVARQTVHYHFGTIDDLLAAVLRHGFEDTRENVRRALKEKDPVDAIWDLFSSTNPVTSEFMALALRNEAIGVVWRDLLSELHEAFDEAIAAHVSGSGAKRGVSTEGVALVLQIVSQHLSFEAALGSNRGHANAERMIKALARKAIGLVPTD